MEKTPPNASLVALQFVRDFYSNLQWHFGIHLETRTEVDKKTREKCLAASAKDRVRCFWFSDSQNL